MLIQQRSFLDLSKVVQEIKGNVNKETFRCQELKVSLFLKDFLVSSILPKNERKIRPNSTMMAQVKLFSFGFWKN